MILWKLNHAFVLFYYSSETAMGVELNDTSEEFDRFFEEAEKYKILRLFPNLNINVS